MIADDRANRAGLLADARRQVERRLIALPQFPLDFDVSTASDEMLALYGLPPRPTKSTDPLIATLLNQALSPQLHLCTVKANDLCINEEYRLGQARAGSNMGRIGSSTNWSGAIRVPSRARRFSWIGARWKVPVPKAPLNANGTIDDGDYRVSTWIGLDGFYARSASLPQVGTTQQIVVQNGIAGEPSYDVWFQWWVRHELYPPVTFCREGHLIAGGDEMMAILAVDSGNTEVCIFVANLTKGWGKPLRFHGSNEASLPAVGSTAEWVAETPQSFDPPYAFYPLPDFGPIDFTNCATAAAHDAPSLLNGADIRCARRIAMRKSIAGLPHRSAVIARPSALTTESIRVEFRSPYS